MKYVQGTITTAVFIAIGILLLAGWVEAKAETVVGIHLASHHFPAQDWQRNANPGLYVKTDDHVVAGLYRNSLGRTSGYLGYVLESERWPVALTIGLVSGYQKRPEVTTPSADGRCDAGGPPPCLALRGVSNSRLTLMLAPSVRLPAILGLTPRLSVIPRFGTASTVLHLSVEKRL